MTAPKSYAVTKQRNSQTQCWRGKLRGYAVTHGSYMCVRMCRRVCACRRVCVRDGPVTA